MEIPTLINYFFTGRAPPIYHNYPFSNILLATRSSASTPNLRISQAYFTVALLPSLPLLLPYSIPGRSVPRAHFGRRRLRCVPPRRAHTTCGRLRCARRLRTRFHHLAWPVLVTSTQSVPAAARAFSRSGHHCCQLELPLWPAAAHRLIHPLPLFARSAPICSASRHPASRCARTAF